MGVVAISTKFPQRNREPADAGELTRPSGVAGGREGGGKVPPWVNEGRGGEEVSFGAWLRRQREMREIDLREIADRTKISLRYLKAMEQDRFDLLPAPVFAKGFLREYAKYVGLNPDEVVNFYLSAQEDDEEEDHDEVVAQGRPGASSPWTWGVLLALAAVLLLAVVAYLAFYAESRRDGRRTAPSPIATLPRAEAPPPVVPPPPEPERSATLEVTLDFTQECWVEVVVDGRERISELHVQGESLQLAARESVLLASIGNPAGVEVQVNGMPFDLGGSLGRPVHDVRIDLEALERLRSRTPR